MKREKEKDTGISPWPWCIGIEKVAHLGVNGKKEVSAMPCLMDADRKAIFVVDVVVTPGRENELDQDRYESNAFLMASAPELRDALLNLTRNICSDCRRRMKSMRKTDATPCETDGDCPKGLGDALHAIAKSYGKGD